MFLNSKRTLSYADFAAEENGKQEIEHEVDGTQVRITEEKTGRDDAVRVVQVLDDGRDDVVRAVQVEDDGTQVRKAQVQKTISDESEHEVEQNETPTLKLCQCETLELVLNSDSQNAREKCAECKKWEKKYHHLKMLYLKLANHHAEVDLKYHDLLKTKTSTVPLPSDGTVSSSDDVFSAREVNYLRCMPLEKKNDSTFVLHCLTYAYKDNVAVLKKKTLKGKSEVQQISENGCVEHVVPAKDPLTPKKVEQIRDLFIERISKCQLDPVSYGERIKDTYLNKIIASSIRNIVKKSKCQST